MNSLFSTSRLRPSPYSSEIVRKFPSLLPHLLQVIGNAGGEIVVVVLPLLPAGDVAFRRHNAPVHLHYGLVGGYRHDVDGQHHVAGVVHQLRDHGALDKAGILSQEQGTAYAAIHGVIDNKKAPGLGKPAAYLKDTVLIDSRCFS